MKERKIALVLLMLTLTFAGFCVGLFIGKQREPASVTIYTTKTPTATVSESTAAPESPPESTQGAAYVDGLLDINLASVEDLTTLPGIGPALAQRIVDYRGQNGRFSSVEELMQVEGIKEKTYEKLKNQIRIN